MRRFITICAITGICSMVPLLAAATTALAQAGSTGGTIGKTDKSASGGEQNEPRTQTKRHGNLRQKNSIQQSETGTAVAGSIKVTSATLGQNCGAPVGNVTEKVGAICNGQRTCELPGSKVNDPDPAVGCSKTFAATWRCGQNSRMRSNSVPASFFESSALTLSCN
jgi:hypothetical protein